MNTVAFFIINISVAMQLISAFVALRLIVFTQKRAAGIAMLIVTCLMVFRRCISLYRVLTGGDIKVDLFAEIIACTISFIFLVGFLYLSRLIADLEQEMLKRRDAEKSMLETTARLQALIYAIPDIVVFKDVEGRHVVVNKSAEAFMGFKQEELAGKTNEELLPPDLASTCTASDQEAMRSPKPVQSEDRFKGRNGAIIFLDTIKAPIYDERGILKGLVGVSRDITERKLAEEALRMSEERLRLALSAAKQGLYDLDIRTGKAAVSPEYAAMLGYNPDDFRETHERWYERLHPDDRADVMAVYRDCIGGKIESYTLEFRQQARSGEWKWILSRGKVAARDPEGKPLRLLGTYTDITERRKLLDQLEHLNRTLSERVQEEIRKNHAKEQLMQLQSRHAAMGEMIDNIAHQWRQPLNNLGLIMQGMQLQFGDGTLTQEKMMEKVKTGVSIIRYMSQTINDFSNFFRHDKALTRFDVQEVVKTALSFMQTTLKRNGIDVLVDIREDVIIAGYRNEYTQVIVNILNNARDVFVERRIQKPQIDIRGFRVNGSSVLTISDNGGGISEEIVDRVFVPYFTTKAQNKGTGIGLYMSKTIIENNMKGKLSVRNNGAGAEFRVEVRHAG